MSFISELFGGAKTPTPQPIVQPPARQDAAPAGETARRKAAGRGAVASVLTGELGVGGNTNGRPRLLGGV